jgi:FAD dependent oxidoreductase
MTVEERQNMQVEIHKLECDIFVAGGGMAGVSCALAAARCGAHVILCQDRPVLGGNASSEVRMHIVGANGTGATDRGVELATEAREGGIIEEIRLDNSTQNPQRSASVFDLILYDKCRSEPNLTLLLNTCVVGATRQGCSIETAIADRPSTEDRFEVSAKVFVDCTGDGRLAMEAGAAFMEGRESRDSHDESLAQSKSDNSRLGSTILLTARRHSQEMPFAAPAWARRFTKEDLRLRLYSVPGEEQPTHEYGYWWAEWGGTLDTIKDNEVIRDELMSIALGIWDHIKNGPPEDASTADPFDAAQWALDWIGFLPGKRESRRFLGQHVLTEQDLMQSRRFADAVAYGGWSIDLHPPEGVDRPASPPCEQHPLPWLYDIPLRCCVARDISNLMFAGRNLSATHVAFASTRVMATCAVIGQGVGTSAAWAVKAGIAIDQLAGDVSAMQQIRQQLLRDDAFLIGEPAVHAFDVARFARITASSEVSGGEADNVVSGFARSVHGSRGVEPSRRTEGTHRWMSAPKDGLPATLRLDWPEPIAAVEVRVVFDTGMHRHLTLSHHDGYTQRMIWGQPQPETVRHYTIDVECGEGWKTIVDVSDNYQRLNCHRLELSPPVRSMRIRVLATNGLDHARILDVRVFTSDRAWQID